MICGLSTEIFSDFLVRLRPDGSGLTVEEAKAFDRFMSNPDSGIQRRVEARRWRYAISLLPSVRIWLDKVTRPNTAA